MNEKSAGPHEDTAVMQQSATRAVTATVSRTGP